MINDSELLLRQSNDTSDRTLDKELLCLNTKTPIFEDTFKPQQVYKLKWYQASMTAKTLSFTNDMIRRYGNEIYYLQMG